MCTGFFKKAFLFSVFVVSFCFAQDQQVQPGSGSFALGGIAGERPWLGGTVKYWLTDNLAIDGVLGYRWDFHMQANLTYNLDKFFDFPKGEMRVFFGGGTWVDVPFDVEFGMQAKGGAEWFMPWARWGIFAEILPGINFLDPHQSDIFSGNIGARYYF